jgi:hypothetical protein
MRTESTESMMPGSCVPGGGQGKLARVRSSPGMTFSDPVGISVPSVLAVRPLLGRLVTRRLKLKL